MMNVNNKSNGDDLLEDQNHSASASSPPAEDVEVAPPEPPARRQFPNVTIPARDPAVLSGGGISFLSGDRNAKFSYGYCSFKGKRASMEDFYETRISEVDGQMVAFFGVFDGHGGSRTAEYLKNNLFKNLSSHPDFIRDTKSAIVEAFRQTDANYLLKKKDNRKMLVRLHQLLFFWGIDFWLQMWGILELLLVELVQVGRLLVLSHYARSPSLEAYSI